ncbi:hypothetical protein GZ77_19175 [Endozoicomonas montiporae]|uniref:Acid phosphatase n=2 Tax=Endozoicomonas montiporae TaxID=1027273 RepID=A0A081N2F0_9GAMM|nr:histidine phosphatase family protein [Endozoicomonas montiporae]AMO58411.1 major acid phosphatase [Endozoicomonas montiporae CL-33]KEQ12623.1 hypothetical protein GZ77_19175 [Endozoicomonas montiporae]
MNNLSGRNVLFVFMAAIHLLPHLAIADTPDFLISLVRHGDRSPRVPLNEELWPMGKGELTVEGTRQCFELGKNLRQRYFQDNLPATWHSGYSRHIAKGLNRTIQSANAILQGFYPAGVAPTGLPDQTQIPPLFAYPPESDFLFSAHHICPGFVNRMESLEASDEWQKKRASYGTRFSYWAEVANKPKQIYSLIPLMDALLIRKLYNIPLPDKLTPEDQEQLLGLLDWFFQKLVQDQEMLQLLSGNFIQELVKTLSNYQSCQGKSCERFVLYVASDINLLTFLAIMGLPRSENVGYGAHLDIVVKGYQGKHTVKLMLNNELLALPACGVDCSLEQLLSLFRQKLPQNWQALCSFGTGVQLKNSLFKY